MLTLAVFGVAGAVCLFEDRAVQDCADLVRKFGLTLFKAYLLLVVVFVVLEGGVGRDVLDKLLDCPETSLTRLGLDDEFFHGESHGTYPFLPVAVISGGYVLIVIHLNNKIKWLFIVRIYGAKKTKNVTAGNLFFGSLPSQVLVQDAWPDDQMIRSSDSPAALNSLRETDFILQVSTYALSS